ncbi:MAG: hypothetical protein Q8K20_13840 [Gemmobacter sp.]|nr:hypothetical protein [Gemmobacter sp.]
MADFLAQCRRHPHCGDGSILSLRKVLEDEAAALLAAAPLNLVH